MPRLPGPGNGALMPEPAQALPVPPVDPGNRLLGPVPAELTCAVLGTPAGQRLALTIRTGSATLTVFLDKAAAGSWAAAISGNAGRMSGSGLVVA